jgi:hypothetical protein
LVQLDQLVQMVLQVLMDLAVQFHLEGHVLHLVQSDHLGQMDLVGLLVHLDLYHQWLPYLQDLLYHH